MNRIIIFFALMLIQIELFSQFYFATSYHRQQLFSVQFNSKDGSFTTCYSSTRRDCAVDFTLDTFKTFETLLDGKNERFQNTFVKYIDKDNRVYVRNRGVVYYNLPYFDTVSSIKYLDETSVNEFLDQFFVRPYLSGGMMDSWFVNDSEPDSLLIISGKVVLLTKSGFKVYQSDDDEVFELITKPQKLSNDLFYFAAIPLDTSVHALDSSRRYSIYEGSHLTQKIVKKATLDSKFTPWLHNYFFLTRNNLGDYFIASSMEPFILHKFVNGFSNVETIFDSRWSYGGQRIVSFVFDYYSKNTFFLTFAGEFDVFKTTDGFKSLYPVPIIPKPDNPLVVSRIELFSERLIGIIGKDIIYLSTNRGGSPYTGVDEADVLPRWNVYPNPVMDNLTLHGNHSGEARYAVCDMQGRELMNMSGKVNGQATIEVGHLSPGIYLLRISSAQGSSTLKFLKQ